VVVVVVVVVLVVVVDVLLVDVVVLLSGVLVGTTVMLGNVLVELVGEVDAAAVVVIVVATVVGVAASPSPPHATNSSAAATGNVTPSVTFIAGHLGVPRGVLRVISFLPSSQLAPSRFSTAVTNVVFVTTTVDTNSTERNRNMNAPWAPPTAEQPAEGPAPTSGAGRRNRRTTAIGLTAGLIGGGAIGLMLGVPGLTSAATDDASTTPAAVVVEDSADAGTDGQPAADCKPGEGRGGQRGGRGFDGEVVAELLGIDAATLRAELVGGATIAEVAAENGVDPQIVIDALVAEAKSHLDLSVTNGRLTQEEADAKLTQATERITDRVNNGGPLGGEGRGPRGGAPAADAPADSSSGESGS
jgi:hypothetical protein